MPFHLPMLEAIHPRQRSQEAIPPAIKEGLDQYLDDHRFAFEWRQREAGASRYLKSSRVSYMISVYKDSCKEWMNKALC